MHIIILNIEREVETVAMLIFPETQPYPARGIAIGQWRYVRLAHAPDYTHLRRSRFEFGADVKRGPLKFDAVFATLRRP